MDVRAMVACARLDSVLLMTESPPSKRRVRPMKVGHSEARRLSVKGASIEAISPSVS
jgi:hypothetical protein